MAAHVAESLLAVCKKSSMHVCGIFYGEKKAIVLANQGNPFKGTACIYMF